MGSGKGLLGAEEPTTPLKTPVVPGHKISMFALSKICLQIWFILVFDLRLTSYWVLRISLAYWVTLSHLSRQVVWTPFEIRIWSILLSLNFLMRFPTVLGCARLWGWHRLLSVLFLLSSRVSARGMVGFFSWDLESYWPFDVFFHSAVILKLCGRQVTRRLLSSLQCAKLA